MTSRFATEPDAETDDSLSTHDWHLCDTCGEDIDNTQPVTFVTSRGEYFFHGDICLNAFLASLEDDGD